MEKSIARRFYIFNLSGYCAAYMRRTFVFESGMPVKAYGTVLTPGKQVQKCQKI